MKRLVISKKVMILTLKEGTARSGFTSEAGHRGIPKRRGGSLPRGVNPADVIQPTHYLLGLGKARRARAAAMKAAKLAGQSREDANKNADIIYEMEMAKQNPGTYFQGIGDIYDYIEYIKKNPAPVITVNDPNAIMAIAHSITGKYPTTEAERKLEINRVTSAIMLLQMKKMTDRKAEIEANRENLKQEADVALEQFISRWDKIPELEDLKVAEAKFRDLKDISKKLFDQHFQYSKKAGTVLAEISKLEKFLLPGDVEAHKQLDILRPEYQRLVALRDERYDEYKKANAAAFAYEQNEVNYQKREIRNARGELVIDIFGHDKADQSSFKILTDNISKKHPLNGNIREAMDFFQAVISKKAVAEVVPIIAFRGVKDRRSYFADMSRLWKGEQSPGIVNLSNSVRAPAEAGSIIHELGHWFEHDAQSIHDETVAFLVGRVKDNPIFTSGNHHGSNEYFQKGGFDEYYTGKVYTTLPTRIYSGRTAKEVRENYEKTIKDPTLRSSTEVISTGLEQLYLHPHEMALKDPDFFKFMYRILHT